MLIRGEKKQIGVSSLAATLSHQLLLAMICAVVQQMCSDKAGVASANDAIVDQMIRGV